MFFAALPLGQPEFSLSATAWSYEAIRTMGDAVINKSLIFNHENTAANHIRAEAC